MYSCIKRLFDFTVALSWLFVLLPAALIVTFTLFLSNKGKPFFVQKRIGKGEKIIRIIKFRTMTDELGENGELLANSMRITKIGKLIRRLSLDELPQLISVLRGDLSFVGPRPLLPEYLPLYTAQQRLRHSVLPGITGFAQLYSKETISWQQKLEYDIWYVKNASIMLDFKIFFVSLFRLVSGRGMSEQESLSRFNGKN